MPVSEWTSRAHLWSTKLERVIVHRPGWPGSRTRTDEETMGKQVASEADYVVVGSGSSGSAVAGRLAQAGHSVILLEAGKTDEKFLVRKPGMIGPMHAVPE